MKQDKELTESLQEENQRQMRDIIALKQKVQVYQSESEMHPDMFALIIQQLKEKDTIEAPQFEMT